MKYQTIILEKKEAIAIVTLNLPEVRNALTSDKPMIPELISALNDVDEDDEMRVMVLTGAGKDFSSGGDIKVALRDSERPAPETRKWLHQGAHKLILRLHKMQKPTIAMVNGSAVGAGFDLALACDLRMGSESTRFMSGYSRLGVPPGFGATWLYPRVMGLPKALEYLFTQDWIEAKEAEKLGVLNHVVPTDELEKETMSLASKIANGSPLGMILTKLQVYEGLGMDLETALQVVAGYQAVALTSEDFKEGLKALLEKRQPEFRGK
ncbi:enoyl-CoA hydratase/isomerase family protein [Chloroflexota bacterium]